MAMNVLEAQRSDLRIELGGLYLPVAQLLPDAEKIGASFEHVRRVAVSQDVRRHPGDAGLQGGAIDDPVALTVTGLGSRRLNDTNSVGDAG